ncbi:MAG: DUF3822 family protein [Bacteroidales bacterium]|nr:DUF3822 family protein [Bacteroidales bacterium]
MNEINCLDETLDISSTSLYHLSLQISMDGFCYAIHNSINKKYIALKYIPFPPNISDEVIYEKIEEVLNKEEFLKQNYKTVKSIYLSPKYTLIPDEFFNEKSIKEFYELNHYLSDLDEIHYNQINSLNAKLIFSIPSQIGNSLYNNFQKIKYFHHATTLISNTLKNQLKGPVIRLNVNDNFFDLLIINENKLKLHNTFLYKTSNDIAYYLMYSLNSLNIDTAKTNIICSGFISKSGAIIKTLKQYFPVIKFQTPDTDFVYSYTFNKIPSHTFVNLLNLHTCE